MLATLYRSQERTNTKCTHGTWGQMKMRTWKRALIHLSMAGFSVFLEVHSLFIYKVKVSAGSKVRFNPNNLQTQFRPGKVRWRSLFPFRRATRHVAINISTQLIQHHPNYISKAKLKQSRCVQNQQVAEIFPTQVSSSRHFETPAHMVYLQSDRSFISKQPGMAYMIAANLKFIHEKSPLINSGRGHGATA